MHELALFAGAGGGILGGLLCGWRTVAAVEIEEYPRAVLLQRQLDGILPRFPVWDDIRTFDGRPWRGKVDIVTGGFPCQDISAAGKGAGLAGERSGLWFEMARVIGEVKPRYVLVENTPRLVKNGLERVLSDLECLGYGGSAGFFSSLAVTGYDVRNRIFIFADSARFGWEWRGCSEQTTEGLEFERLGEEPFRERAFESGIDGIRYGVPNRMDRLKAIGNAQNPLVVKIAWETLR